MEKERARLCGGDNGKDVLEAPSVSASKLKPGGDKKNIEVL